MRLFLVLAVLASLNTCIYAADSGKIAGKVTDAQTGDPLVGANILVEGTNLGAATNVNGDYVITNVPPAIYSVRCSYIGYQSVLIKNVLVKKDSLSRQDFRLSASKVQVQELAITGLNASPGQSRSRAQSAFLTPFFGILESTIPKFHTEEYDRIYENEFLDVLSNPLSTFSIDVDAASYANVRRFINDGALPPQDAVRIEEMINYFSYDYPQPTDEHPFSATTELSTAPWNPSNRLLLIGLRGKIIPQEHLSPSNLVFLLDVSGSMDEPNKLPLVKSAFKMLVNQVRDVDRVSIVVYAGRAGLVLPSTPGSDKKKIIEAIEELEAGGSTAGGEGIVLAYKIAKQNFIRGGNNRVILATDGDFNVGVSSDAELVRLIEEKRQDGIFLSVLGFGMGNYKDSKMEQLADKGNGNYAYIDNISEARRVFVGQMAGTLYTIAKDVKIQIEFNPAKVKAYRLIGYENRLLSKEDFIDDQKDAGELGVGHSVTALYEIIPPEGKIAIPHVDPLKYQELRIKPEAKQSNELLLLKLRYKPPADSISKLMTKVVYDKDVSLDHVSINFRFASAVAQFGMLLRDSKFKANSSYDQVSALAKQSIGTDKDGFRTEFVQLVESCKFLSKSARKR